MTYTQKVVIGDATLYQGDCMDIFPTLGKVDCVITDPPYIGMKGNTALSFTSGVAPLRNISKTVADPWDANLDWVIPAWDVAELGLFVWCSFHFVAELNHAVPAKPTALLSWYQRNGAPSAANAPQFKNEFCWAFRKAPGLNWRKLETHMDVPRLQAGCMATERILNSDGSTAHPTQKPLEVISRILAIGGKTILDPFMGSGTTGVAAIQLGRKFIGIEREPKYFDIACKRIQQAHAQGQLFAPEQPKQTQEALL